MLDIYAYNSSNRIFIKLKLQLDFLVGYIKLLFDIRLIATRDNPLNTRINK